MHVGHSGSVSVAMSERPMQDIEVGLFASKPGRSKKLRSTTSTIASAVVQEIPEFPRDHQDPLTSGGASRVRFLDIISKSFPSVSEAECGPNEIRMVSQGFHSLVSWFNEHRDLAVWESVLEEFTRELCGAYHAYAVQLMTSVTETRKQNDILVRELEDVQGKKDDLALTLTQIEADKSEGIQKLKQKEIELERVNKARDRAESEVTAVKKAMERAEEELKHLEEVGVDNERVRKEAMEAMNQAVLEKNSAEIARAVAEANHAKAQKRIAELEEQRIQVDMAKQLAEEREVEACKRIEAMLLEKTEYRLIGVHHMSEADKLNRQLTTILEHERKEKQELLTQLNTDRTKVQTDISFAERTIHDLYQMRIEDSAVLEEIQAQNQKLNDELKGLKLALYKIFPELSEGQLSSNNLLSMIEQVVYTLINELKQIIRTQCARVSDTDGLWHKFEGQPLSLARQLKHSINECIQLELQVYQQPIAQVKSANKRHRTGDRELSIGAKQKRRADAGLLRGTKWQAAVAGIKREPEEGKRLCVKQELFDVLSKAGDDLRVVSLGNINSLGGRLCSLLLHTDKQTLSKLLPKVVEEQISCCHCNHLAKLARVLECRLIVLLMPSSCYHSYGSEKSDALYVLLHHEGDYFIAMVSKDQNPSVCMWTVSTELTCRLKRLEHLDSGCGLLPEFTNSNMKGLIDVQIEQYIDVHYDSAI